MTTGFEHQQFTPHGVLRSAPRPQQTGRRWSADEAKSNPPTTQPSFPQPAKLGV